MGKTQTATATVTPPRGIKEIDQMLLDLQKAAVREGKREERNQTLAHIKTLVNGTGLLPQGEQMVVLSTLTALIALISKNK